MKITLSVYLNSLILLCALFFAFLLIFLPLNIALGLKIALSLLISMPISLLFFYRQRSLASKRSQFNLANKKIANCSAYLSMLTSNKLAPIFDQLFKLFNIEYKKLDKFFIFGKQILCPMLHVKTVSQENLIEIFDSIPSNFEPIIIAQSIDSTLITNDILPSYKFFALDDLSKILVENSLIDVPTKINKRFNFSNLFLKINGKKFLFYGTILLILSSFVFYPIFYRISGAIFIVFGLIGLLFGKKPLPNKQEDLQEILSKFSLQ